jgi:hypothetical protein
MMMMRRMLLKWNLEIDWTKPWRICHVKILLKNLCSGNPSDPGEVKST